MKAALHLALVMTAGCATLTGETSGPTAAIGEIAKVDGLTIKPMAVLEDSRCPVDVTCIWAGRLVVRAEAAGRDWRQQLDLELGKGQQVAGGTLTLRSVRPPARTESRIGPGAYRFTFYFEPGS